MTYEELTIGLSEKNSQAFLLCPMFIGGDSVDMETFVEDVWRQPVTDDNYKEVAQEFKKWYAKVAPDEFHEPTPTPSLLSTMRGATPGRPPIGDEPGKKRSLHATDADWQWLGEVGDGSPAEGLRRLRRLLNS